MTSSQAILNGDRLALARLLTKVENNSPEGRAALIELISAYRQGASHRGDRRAGHGQIVAGESVTLHYRKTEDKRVAIVAVDPSSPFTGGAVLGDRVRMRDLSGDPGVFIRSMASRGSLGGLAQATANMVQVFDAAGFDIVIIETVGAGQSEVDIARLAHTTLVVEAPGLGDDIQAIKAGILEIADILVINKADRPGVENTEKALKSMLELAHPTERVFRHHGTYMNVHPCRRKSLVPCGFRPSSARFPPKGRGSPNWWEADCAACGRISAQSGDWAVRERTRLRGRVGGVDPRCVAESVS
jgi:LAO/AO transport system kinase